ncbi:MAG: hypothetical protein QXM43_09920, partial [Desulfurococcaceae archaeon]
TTLTRKTINLSEPKTVIIVFEGLLRNYTSYSRPLGGNLRCLLNSVPIAAFGYREISVGANTAVSLGYTHALLKLSPGSYDFVFQGSLVYNPISGETHGVQIRNIYIGAIEFEDLNSFPQQSILEVPNNSTATVLSFMINAPNGRRTTIGEIKKAILYLIGTFSCEGYSGNKLKNPGESDESCLNWKLYVNDVQVPWTLKVDDYQTRNQSYGEGAYGRYDAPVDLGSQINVRVDVTNLSGANRIVSAHVSALCSPWLLPTNEAAVLDLSLPQGSTLYVTAEPLLGDPTKMIRIGKRRAAFGSYDFYMASGTGILTASYTFDYIPPEKIELSTSGFGGCISVIGVDVRA